MRLIEAGSFFASYNVMRLVGAKRLYNGEWGGFERTMGASDALHFSVLAAVVFAAQLLLQSACVNSCTLVLSLPPYVSDRQRKLAALVVAKHRSGSGSKAVEECPKLD